LGFPPVPEVYIIQAGEVLFRFAFIILSMIPPILVVVFLQRWFIQGLIQTEK